MRKLIDARIHGGGREAIDQGRDWWRILGQLGGIPHHLTMSVRESSWRWQTWEGIKNDYFECTACSSVGD